MRKVYILIIVALLYSCNLTNQYNKTSVVLKVSADTRAFDSSEIERIELKVSGPGMEDVSKLSITNSISVDIPQGNNRHFELSIFMTDGREYFGDATKDLKLATESVDISIFLVSEKKINFITFQDVESTFSISDNDITVVVPKDVDITKLIPVIEYTGANISPETGIETDFTDSVTYTVTAENNTTIDYNVSVEFVKDSVAEITSFTFQDIDCQYQIVDKDIFVSVPVGTDITALVPVVGFSGSSISPNPLKETDFTKSQTFTVTAEDGSVIDYTVSVLYLNKTGISVKVIDYVNIFLGDNKTILWGDDLILTATDVPTETELEWSVNGAYYDSSITSQLSFNLLPGENRITCEFVDKDNLKIGFGEVVITVSNDLAYTPSFSSDFIATYDNYTSQLDLFWSKAIDVQDDIDDSKNVEYYALYTDNVQFFTEENIKQLINLFNENEETFLYCGSNSGLGIINPGDTTTLSYTGNMYNLTASTTLYFCVIAKDSDGNITPSNSAELTGFPVELP